MILSTKEKLLKRLLEKRKDFTYGELKLLLEYFGFIEYNSGKTSGSRVKFINTENKHIILLHKPHPGNILKSYVIEYIIKELIKGGYINE